MLLHQIASVPVVGMAALLIILVTLVAHRDLPGHFPGMLASLLIGTALYYIGRVAGVMPPLEASAPSLRFDFGPMVSFYSRDGAWWGAVMAEVVHLLPVALPFALATVVGGIDCTESAAAAGDEYDTRSILAVEGVASLLAGLLGGVIQTTPYIGQPAYKKMGGRAAYTLATALFVGAVGLTGGVSFLFAVFPEGAMFPILVFVGLEITAASFHHTPTKHYPALAIAVMPALAALALVILGNVHGPTPPFNERGHAVVQTLRCLASGFIVSGLLWAAALAMIIDGRLRMAAGYMLAGAVFAFFGVIHSPLAPEKIGLPWDVLAAVPKEFEAAVRYQSPYHWAAAYGLMAGILMGLDWWDARRGTAAEDVDEVPPLPTGEPHPAAEGGQFRKDEHRA
jgi:AGZA family xanthine/uracil permease-like MFS transporter